MRDDNLSALINLLGEENIEDLKKRIVDMLVVRAEDDLEDCTEWLLYPPDFTEVVNEAFESTQKKIEKMYKDAMLEINKDYINKMKSYMSSQVSEASLRKQMYDLAKSYYWQSNQYGKERKFAEEIMEILGVTQEELELENC